MSFPLCYCIDKFSNLDQQASRGKFIMSLSLTQCDSNDFLPSDHIYVMRRNVEEVLGNRATDSSGSLIINDGARRFLLNSSIMAVPTDWPWSTCMTRSSEILFLAINQHYPEIEGGFYQNAELIALIQIVLSSVRCRFTEKKYYRMERFVPCVYPGALKDDTDYVLFNESCSGNSIEGFARLWQDMGSDDSYFHNRRILAIMKSFLYFIEEALYLAIPGEYITFKTTQP